MRMQVDRPERSGPSSTLVPRGLVQNTATERSLAHELGHLLLDPGPHQVAATGNVMVPTAAAPLAESFTNADCTTIHGHA